jgi:hypothetical protein
MQNYRNDYEPDVEGSAADIFWLLLAIVAVAGVVKQGGGHVPSKPTRAPLIAKADGKSDAKASEALKAVAIAKQLDGESESLRETPVKLPADDALRNRLAPHAEAKRLVFLVDPRTAMGTPSPSANATYMAVVQKQIEKVLLGAQQVQQVLIAPLGDADGKCTISISGPLTAVQAVEVCKRIIAWPNTDLGDLGVALGHHTSEFETDQSGTAVFLFLLDQPAGTAPTDVGKWRAAVHITLLGDAHAQTLLPWSLGVAKQTNGSACFLR